MDFTYHTTDDRSILHLNYLRDLAKAKSLKSTLLIYRVTDFAFNLLCLIFIVAMYLSPIL